MRDSDTPVAAADPARVPARGHGSEPGGESSIDVLASLRDDSGRTLRSLSDERPTLVCLLRHNGCTFCRQTLAELAGARDAILKAGLNIAVVGMSESCESLRLLGERFGLAGVSWVADPHRILYRWLGVRRGGFLQLFGPSVIRAGVRGLLRGYGIGRIEGDPFQMPGTAVIHKGKVLRTFVHRNASDHPDYQALACEVAP